MRMHIVRDDPQAGTNQEPSLLGTNAQLRRRSKTADAVTNVLVISGPPVLGGNGHFVVDSPGKNLNGGINVQDHLYWIQLELKQETPATAATRNAVIGLQLFLTT